MADRKVVVGLDIETGRFISSLKKADTAWGRFKRNIFSVKNAIGAVFAGAAVRQIISVGGELIQAAEGQMKAEAQLVQVMKQKGVYTEKAADSLMSYAEALQFATTYQDEDIMQVQRILMQYGVFGETLNKATRSVLDMAASGKSMTGSAEMLGRVMQGNTTMLSRYGISMNMVKAAGGGLEGTLSVLNQLFGGQAAAIANTPLGKLERMKNLWGDFKENVGIGLVNAISGVSTSLGMTNDNMEKLNASMGKILISNAESFFYDVASGISAVVGAAQALVATLKILNPLYYVKRAVSGESLMGGIRESIDSGTEAFKKSIVFRDLSFAAEDRAERYRKDADSWAGGFSAGMKTQQRALEKRVADGVRAGR